MCGDMISLKLWWSTYRMRRDMNINLTLCVAKILIIHFSWSRCERCITFVFHFTNLFEMLFTQIRENLSFSRSLVSYLKSSWNFGAKTKKVVPNRALLIAYRFFFVEETDRAWLASGVMLGILSSKKQNQADGIDLERLNTHGVVCV